MVPLEEPRTEPLLFCLAFYLAQSETISRRYCFCHACNGTVGTIGKSMVLLATNGTIGSITEWYHWENPEQSHYWWAILFCLAFCLEQSENISRRYYFALHVMVLFVPFVSQWCHWLPMVPLVKFPMVPLGKLRTEPLLVGTIVLP